MEVAWYDRAVLEDILRGPLSFHSIAPPALEPFRGLDEQLRVLAHAAREMPERAAVHAAIGNGLSRLTRYTEAIAAYRVAVETEPGFAIAHLALGELLHIAHDPLSANHMRRALALNRLYPDPRARAGCRSVLMLLRDAPYSVNAPLELIVDSDEIALHKYYVDGMLEETLPRHELLWCALGYAQAAAPAIAAAVKFAARRAGAIINEPSHLMRAAREHLAKTLASVDRSVVAGSRLHQASEIVVNRPILVRPMDTHAGSGLARVTTAEELHAHTTLHPSALYAVAPFIDYISSDGFYRKYRIMLIDGKPCPYHLAISPRWMVHYGNAPMAQHEWMRVEEQAFLEEPEAVFADWPAPFDAVAAALGLDYVGIDCAVLPARSVLIFEADPAMLVHDEDPSGAFAYKHPAVARIRHEITTMVERMAANAP